MVNLLTNIIIVKCQSTHQKFGEIGELGAMQRFSLFDYVSVDLLFYPEFQEKLSSWAGEAKQFRQIILANVQVAMMARSDRHLQELLEQADLTLCDGKPLVILSRLLGQKTAHFYGPWLTIEICRMAEVKGWRLGFFGGAEFGNLDLHQALLKRFPQLKIAKMIAPPMLSIEQLDTPDYCKEFVVAECDLLFVGLGWPKQELWSAINRRNLPLPCMNVGAAFDFISGKKKSPPDILVHLGLGWLFRLCTDFRHTYRRYFKYNVQFVGCALMRVLFKPKPPHDPGVGF